MDDQTRKYCNYKTTDCTVVSTRDLYKGLNFPKRFECPCKSFEFKLFVQWPSFKIIIRRFQTHSMVMGFNESRKIASIKQQAWIMVISPRPFIRLQ